MNETPYHIIKKVAVIRELNYKYHIDEDGYGVAYIDTLKVEFFVDHYGHVDLCSVKIIYT
jgi:hypothetical protein